MNNGKILGYSQYILLFNPSLVESELVLTLQNFFFPFQCGVMRPQFLTRYASKHEHSVHCTVYVLK
ncbi:hypothetical protein DERP_010323 [Dermatophagoides pteronyssinus]|uniref:Uncharacterized protein n=1 Tax=Dermatophagoides pteronyssinus TaxID=6956 RepID=A0ABQ8IZ21_DERPT|nr:hypothetical protein DERP_010323 [Dermatophagoides pteronyssinus]